MNTILEQVKLALRVTTNAFDDEINDIINACLADLGIAGVTPTDTADALIVRAVKTFAKFNFGDARGVEEYDRLKASYDEQKAQLQMTTGYTDWLK